MNDDVPVGDIATVDGVALLLWSAGPGDPARLASPFMHAAAAAAMDVPVEVYFTAASVQLLVPGAAERLPTADPARSIADLMRAAVDHGAVLIACSDALRTTGLADRALIAECTRRGGAVQFMARATDRRWRALVF